jgi:hypothetical protein
MRQLRLDVPKGAVAENTVFREQLIEAAMVTAERLTSRYLAFLITDLRWVGVVRSADGLDLESAEPDLGVFNLESDLATR